MIHRRQRRRRRFVRLGWVAFALLLVPASVPIYRAFSLHRRFTQPAVMPGATTAGVPVRPALERHPTRPVYPYSVIRGGVYSAAELHAALRHDSVASAHYAGFRRESLRMTNAPKVAPMYASYRIGNAVYWTRHPVHIAAGEPLIADGTNLARARCGNRLSDSPRQPVTNAEPPVEDMETPNPLEPAEPPDKVSGLHPPATPASALAYEIFPPTSLLGASAVPGTLGSIPARPTGLLPPVSNNLPGSVSTPLSALPFSPVTQTHIPPGGEPIQPGESAMPPALETFQSKTPPETVLKIPIVSPPVLPGVITGTDQFPDGGSKGGSVAAGGSGANPGQPATPTSQPPPLIGGSGPGESRPPSGNPNSPVPGPNPVPTVPEPVTGFLVCAGVAYLYIAARRRRAI